MTAAGDELARVVIERTGMYLGIGISHVINLLNPEVVVVGGEEILAGNFLLGPALEEAERRTFPTAFKACRIVASQLSGNAGAVGAAMLARDRA
jgi:glucokinase